jgi:hypothetical protein
MRRIGLAVILVVGLTLVPFAAHAQRAGNVYRAGLLGPAAERVYTESLRSLRTGLRELGYVEGKNIVFEYRFAEDKYERLPGLAAELVRANVDIGALTAAALRQRADSGDEVRRPAGSQRCARQLAFAPRVDGGCHCGGIDAGRVAL